MLGKFKKKLESFVDNRIVNYFSKNKKVEKNVEDIDMSMAEAETKREKDGLIHNLIYSIQKDFNSLRYSKNGKEFALDSIQTCMQNNKMTGLTGSPKDIVFTFFTKFGYIGWQICSVLSQHWLISNACSISNKDCLRNGWNNIFVDKKDTDMTDEDKDKAQETLNKLFDIEQQKYYLSEKLLKWGFYYNVFGTAFMLPIIDGIDDKAREKPYNPDGIKKGSFRGISVIEPYWMIPEFEDIENVTDPTNINFFEPEFYITSNGKKIHKSHLIIGRRKFVSDILKPSYYYGGISLAQEIYERVYASEKCANETPLLLLTKRLNVYKIKLKDFFLNPAKYKQMAEALTTTRDNQGILFTDRDDDIGQIDTGLGDLEPVIMGQYQLVSAIARIPADKLFETNPTGGLSASGDYNIKNYNQDLNTLQNDLFRPAIDRINEIVMRSEFESKDRVSIVFNPTDNPTEREIAELNNQKAQAIQTYLQNNIITTDEARQMLANDKMSGLAFLKGVEKAEPSKEDKDEIEKMIKKANNNKKEGKDEDDTDWITVKGNHIPIKEDETKKEAVEKFIDKKQNEKSVENSIKNSYNTSSKIEFEKSVSSKDFHSSLKEAKKTIPESRRWRVDDTHKIEDYEHCKRYKTKNGSVIAVTDDGDIISVCKNGKSGDRGSQLLDKAVKEGGKKLDAFGGDLYEFYTRNGFEPVSWCEFNEEYAPYDWKKEYGKEPVIFYKYVGKDKKKKYENYDEFIKKVKVSKDYDTAMNIRNKNMK